MKLINDQEALFCRWPVVSCLCEMAVCFISESETLISGPRAIAKGFALPADPYKRVVRACM